MPLLVSCCGEHGGSGQGTGGLVLIQDREPVVIDQVDTTGICEAQGMVMRVARGKQELWSYSRDGVRCWRWSIHDIKNPHDVRWLRGGRLVLMATGQNEIRWYDNMMNETSRWQAPGEGDAWHLNCLWQADEHLYATAFGAFREHRGWVDKSQMSGFLFGLGTGERVMDSLGQPHSPRFIDGHWYVCESFNQGLAVLNGERVRRVALDGYTRGMDWGPFHLYVGESRLRGDSPVLATVAVLDRDTLELQDRIEVPFPEIYEVLRVTERFAEGLVMFSKENAA
jgi:hypothetical protein